MDRKESRATNDTHKQNNLKKYRAARNEYRTIAINQLSFANNLLLTLAVAFMTLGIDKKDFNEISFSSYASFSYSKFFLILFISSMIVSIIFGVSVIFSRLNDFRVTRHILDIRVKILRKYSYYLGYEILEDPKRKDRLKLFFKLGTYNIENFSQSDIDSFKSDRNNFDEKFKRVRKLAKTLGNASIVWTLWQGLIFLSGILFFFIHLIIS